MSELVNIYSKLASHQQYHIYHKQDNGLNRPEHTVHVKGGAEIAQHTRSGGLWTPLGVKTEGVPAEHVARLRETCAVFRAHEKSGKIIVTDSNGDPEKIAADMTSDKSAPLTPADFENHDGIVGDGNDGQAKLYEGQPRKRGR